MKEQNPITRLGPGVISPDPDHKISLSQSDHKEWSGRRNIVEVKNGERSGYKIEQRSTDRVLGKPVIRFNSVLSEKSALSK